MGFMEKLGATLATKYGVVTSGKHGGCQIALGNAPDKKVEAAYSYEQMIFLMEKEERGRYDIVRDLKCLHVDGTDEYGVNMQILFENDDYSEFTLRFTPEENKVAKILKAIGGGKASGPQTPEQKFHNMIVFFQNTMVKMLPSDIDFFEKYFSDNGVLDDLTKRMIEIYRETFSKQKAEE